MTFIEQNDRRKKPLEGGQSDKEDSEIIGGFGSLRIPTELVKQKDLKLLRYSRLLTEGNIMIQFAQSKEKHGRCFKVVYNKHIAVIYCKKNIKQLTHENT